MPCIRARNRDKSATGRESEVADLFNSVIVGGTAWSGNISYIIFPLSTYLSIRQLAFPTVYCVPLLLLLLPDHCRAIIYVKLFLYLQSSSSLAGGFFSEMRFFLCSTNCHITSANKRCGSGGGGGGGGSCWRGAGVTGWAWVLLLLLAAEIGCGLWHRWKSRRNPGADGARKALMPENIFMDMSISSRRWRYVFLGTKTDRKNRYLKRIEWVTDT